MCREIGEFGMVWGLIHFFCGCFCGAGKMAYYSSAGLALSVVFYGTGLSFLSRACRHRVVTVQVESRKLDGL